MHKVLTGKPGDKILLLGNEAIVRGALEAGVAFASCYPGTPSSEIGDTFFQIRPDSDLYFEYSTNEKVALEIAAGAAVAGIRSICSMKHVGVNVAADALMSLAYTGVNAGMVIVSADDPSLFSSQNEQDNRTYAKFAGLPMLEPSTVQEAKDMAKYAFELSESLKQPVLFRTTTRINHARGIVEFGELAPVVTKGEFTKDPFKYVIVPMVGRKLHKRLLDVMEEARKLSNNSPYNFVEGDGKWGIVCSGVSYGYVMEALRELSLLDKVKVFRVGFSHPLPDERLKEFMKSVEKVLVVEELEPYIEDALKIMAYEDGISVPIKGKAPDLFSRLYEYDTRMVRENIAKYFEIEDSLPSVVDISDAPELPQRPPNLCPGCPHRATYYAVKKVLGQDAIYPTDIGCYTLGLLPPLQMADFLICMGSSIGTSGGFAKATGKPVVAFIGDSTFFHAGIPGLVNAIHNNHNVILVVLDNGTTAMTGHQPHPGVDLTPFEMPEKTIDIEEVVKGLNVDYMAVVNPLRLRSTMKAVEEAAATKGVSVIISREICPLYARRLPGYKKKKPFYVDLTKCKNHRDCINYLACPAFYLEGDNVMIDPNLCIGCAFCTQVCPEKAIKVKKD